MPPKTVVAFWASVASAVFLLGGAVASVEALLRHPSVANAVVLSVSLAGLMFAGLIAGRIILVVGRAQRGARHHDA